MGYDPYDRRYGRDQAYGARDHDRDHGRQSYGRQEDSRGYYGRERDQRDYGRQPQGYDYDERGFFDRAGDEVRSWFGDEEAERRRRWDERNAERDYRSNYGAERSRQSAYGASSWDRDRDRSREDRSPSYADRSVYGRGGGVYASGSSTGGGFGSQAGYSGGGYGDGAGDYGAGFGAGATSQWGLGAGHDRNQWGASDQTYRSWRDRQIEALDRDYEDYRREHQSKFDSEFHSWRQNRQTQRDSLQRVQEHQEVVGSDGQHVGTVDKVRGDRIILTKADADASGHHHSIPCSWIQSVDDKVTISKTAEQAKSHWRDEDRNSAFGSGNRDNDRGQTDLNRSFSGTY